MPLAPALRERPGIHVGRQVIDVLPAFSGVFSGQKPLRFGSGVICFALSNWPATFQVQRGRKFQLAVISTPLNSTSPLFSKMRVVGLITALARLMMKPEPESVNPLMCESRMPISFCFEMAGGRISLKLTAVPGAPEPASSPSMYLSNAGALGRMSHRGPYAAEITWLA